MKALEQAIKKHPWAFRIVAVIITILMCIAGVAWGENYTDTPHCSNTWGDCEPPVVMSVTPCIVQKSHCPHCGAKSNKVDLVEISGEFEGKLIKNGELFLCPNGHIFWEKE